MPKAKTNSPDIRRIARERFGIAAFRPGQEEAIRALLAGRDTLAIMPTGAGKSAIYQVAAAALPGPTVVISPLIALQRDQAESLADDIGGAAVVNSTVGVGERREAFSDLRAGDLEFMFLAPEQLRREKVIARLRAAKPSLFVVDEAHCISEWGYDFRPDYLVLGEVIESLGHPVVLALTATATPAMRDEIVERLRMRKPKRLVLGFDRPNISLGVHFCKNEADKQKLLLEEIARARRPGIVYVATRKHAESVTALLQDAGIDAVFYHAGLPVAEREAAQAAFMDDRAEVMVATSAFGMGIDKPNVRFVFHYDTPQALDAYYQAIGRAGRDGKPAQAQLFYLAKDLNLYRFFAGGGKISEEALAEVAEQIANRGETDVAALADVAGLAPRKLGQALNLLADTGAVNISVGGSIVTANDAPASAAAEAARHQQHLHEQALLGIERMRTFAEIRDCRRAYLLGYFGEDSPPCGACDNCAQGATAPTLTDTQPFAIKTRVTHSQWGAGLVREYEGDKIKVFFDAVGEKVLDLATVLQQALLTRG